jgi:2-oxoglutarate dehydrogenase E2 component (dihydrolipoamide succinyltransferase)
MATKVLMPIMGEGVTDATITKWLIKEGDTVNEFDPIVEVNTDKVDTEVPSPTSGTVLRILPEEGALIEVETVLAWIGKPGEKLPADTAPAKKAAQPNKQAAAPKASTPAPKLVPVAAKPLPTPVPSSAAVPRSTATPATNGPVSVSPLVARIAAENNVNLAQVPASAPGGRMTKDDVLAFIQSGGTARSNGGATTPVSLPKYDGSNMATFLSPVVKGLVLEHNIDVSQIQGSGKEGRITKRDIESLLASGQAPMSIAPTSQPIKAAPKFPSTFPDAVPGQVMPLNTVRKSIADHMVRSKHTSPHVTTIMEADMSAVWAHRAANKAGFAQQGVKLTFTPYFVQAIAAACAAYPIVNSSWTDEGIAVHGQVNVGVATALEPDGLIVPVIQNASALSLLETSSQINDLATRARGKQLKPAEVQGGTITITNHGTSGSLFATPIINQPQCAILGVGVIEKRVKVVDDAIAIRPMVYLGLTFDHRILDGAVADYFLGTIKYTLEAWT